MNCEEYLAFCAGIKGAQIDQPFEGDFESWIVRHADTKKWFAAILTHDGDVFVNLKCDPIESEFLQSVYQGIRPGYHMNKTHWISVSFDSDVSAELLRRLTMTSFLLTCQTSRRRS